MTVDGGGQDVASPCPIIHSQEAKSSCSTNQIRWQGTPETQPPIKTFFLHRFSINGRSDTTWLKRSKAQMLHL